MTGLKGYVWAIQLVFLFGAASLCRGQADPAAELIQSGHWKRARTLVEARLHQAPNDAAAHFYLSQIRNAFGDHSSPLPLAEKAVELDPRVAKYHRQIAEVLGVMAQNSNALQQLLLARRFRKEIDTALALDPRDVQALRDLTEFYLLAPGIAGGSREKAGATAESISAIGAAEGCLAKARVAEFEKRPTDAEAWLKRAAEAQPPSYRAQTALAHFYLAPEHSKLELAERAAQRALALDRGRAEAYALLAEIYAAQSRWNELDALLADSARNVPDDLVAYYRAALRINSAGEDLARAERYLNIYLAQEPEGNEPTIAEAQRALSRVGQKSGSPAAQRRAGERMLQ